MDQMGISGNELTSVILVPTHQAIAIDWNVMPNLDTANTSWNQKGSCNKPIKLQFLIHFKYGNFLCSQNAIN